MGVPRAAQALAPRAGQLVPRYRGIGPEAYLNSTSQGPTPEDDRKDDHIRGRSRPFMKYPGYSVTFLFRPLHVSILETKHVCYFKLRISHFAF